MLSLCEPETSLVGSSCNPSTWVSFLSMRQSTSLISRSSLWTATRRFRVPQSAPHPQHIAKHTSTACTLVKQVKADPPARQTGIVVAVVIQPAVPAPVHRILVSQGRTVFLQVELEAV
eukprot:3003449-Rhodomonas_salina.5